MAFIYWGDGEAIYINPVLPTTGLLYWSDGEPDLIIELGITTVTVELDTPPEMALTPQATGGVEVSISLATQPDISIIALTIAGFEYAVNLEENPNIGIDAATLASTEISIAVYTENLEMIPLDVAVEFIASVGYGVITLTGDYVTGLEEDVNLVTPPSIEIIQLDIIGIEYSVTVNLSKLEVEILEVSVIMGGFRKFPIPQPQRTKNETITFGIRVFPIRK